MEPKLSWQKWVHGSGYGQQSMQLKPRRWRGEHLSSVEEIPRAVLSCVVNVSVPLSYGSGRTVLAMKSEAYN